MKPRSFAGHTGLALAALVASIASAQAQVRLSSYTDAKGYIDVQALSAIG